MLRFIFGDDIFISYSRRDGAKYAAALASQLSEPGRDFSCFLDQWGAEANKTLSKPVVRALGRSRVLVLIGTPGAAQSQFVQQEVDQFSRHSWLRARRPILPINIAGALDKVEWEKLTGLHRTAETEDARAEGLPSAAVVRLITNSHSYTKRNQRVRILSILTLLLLVLSIGASVVATLQRREAIAATAEARLAKDEADKSANKAKEQERLALANEQLAIANEQRAKQNADEASKNAETAKKQAALARANAARAEAQQREAEKQTEIAGARQLAAQAEFAINQQPNLLPRGISLAIDSMRRTPEFEPLAGYDPLRQGLDLLPRQLSLMSHPNSVQAASFSPDGKYIVTACDDKKARVWSTETGGLIAEKSYRSFRALVSLSADARYLIIGESGTFDVWQIKDENGQTLSDQDSRTRKPVSSLTIRTPSVVAVSPNGEYLAAVGYEGGLVRVWNVKTGEVKGEIPSGALAMAFDPTSNHLLVVARPGDKDARVGSMSLTDLERRTNIKWHNITRVEKAAFSADGNYLATADNLSAWVWQFKEERWQEISRIPHQGRVTAVAISREGKTLAVASKDGTARVWSMESHTEIARLTHDSIVTDVAFSADGKYLATAGQDRTARLWEPIIKQLSPRLNHPQDVKAVAFTPDGKFLVSAGKEGVVRIWEPNSDEPPEKLSATMTDGEEQFKTRGIAFSPNGKYVAISITNSTASVWDVLNRKEIAIDSWEDTDVLAISNDGQHFATAYEDENKIIVATVNEAPKTVYEFTAHKAKALAFSPNGQYLAAACADGMARLWAMKDGHELTKLPHAGEVQALTFDADGQRLATASADGFLRVWDWAGSREIVRMVQHSQTRALAFSPSGEYVARVSSDDDVWIWEMKTRREVARLVHAGDISSVTFSPDGNYIATASDDETARIWAWKPAELIKEACSRLPRNQSCQ